MVQIESFSNYIIIRYNNLQLFNKHKHKELRSPALLSLVAIRSVVVLRSDGVLPQLGVAVDCDTIAVL